MTLGWIYQVFFSYVISKKKQKWKKYTMAYVHNYNGVLNCKFKKLTVMKYCEKFLFRWQTIIIEVFQVGITAT
jgi:hypothetical protein